MSEFEPLAGLQVLDLSREQAASACTHVLAQLGASVTRLPVEAPPERVQRAAADSDLIVSDLRHHEARTLGLELHRLAAPGRLLVSVTPFGLDGPHADRAVPFESGLDGRAATALAGAHAAAAALAALRWVRHRAQSAWVEIAISEVVAACSGDLLARVLCLRRDPAQHATEPNDIRPLVSPCADGYVAIATPSAVDRTRLAALVGFQTAADPSVDLAELLGPWLRARTRLEIFHVAQLWRLPVVPVLEPTEVPDDEHTVARGVFAHDQEGQVVSRSPFRFTQSPECAVRQPRPHPLPLSDLRVLDLGVVWAGPYCGRLLAGLGARVTKIEPPARLDPARPRGSTACWGVFADLQRGKASLPLDLSRPSGREVLLRLASRADVLVENFSPRVMPNLGLDYSALSQRNPRLLMLSMPAFGADGPWAHYVAYGGGLELATGLGLRSDDGRPRPAPVPYLDYLAGCYGAVGLLAALLARDQTSRGAHLELAQREVACQVFASKWAGSVEWPNAWRRPETITQDAHLAARELFAPPRRWRGACRHLGRPPWRLHGVPAREERAAPSFGSDTRRVLRQVAGLGSTDLEALVRDGVVGAPPIARNGARR